MSKRYIYIYIYIYILTSEGEMFITIKVVQLNLLDYQLKS